MESSHVRDEELGRLRKNRCTKIMCVCVCEREREREHILQLSSSTHRRFSLVYNLDLYFHFAIHRYILNLVHIG
jgi:hypothetical protein